MEKEEIRHLARLARIAISDEEVERLSDEFDSILDYVKEIQEVIADTAGEKTVGPLHNVFREDGEPDEAGIHTEALLAAAPRRRGDYIEVKKVLDNG